MPVERLGVRKAAAESVLADETANRRIIPSLVVVVQACRLTNRFAVNLLVSEPVSVPFFWPYGDSYLRREHSCILAWMILGYPNDQSSAQA